MVKRDVKIDSKVIHFLNVLKKKYEIHSAYIYGSYSKGNANEWSDIDVAVVSADFSENTFDERLELMKIAATIDDRIEPYPFRIEDFQGDSPLVNEIKKYGIQVSL
jgi:predicted nucleotidyltransferase